MKNVFFSVLMALLVMPAFTPLMSHDGVHAMHDRQSNHHDKEEHAHGHEGHDHFAESEQAVHHSINFDAATYFTDYLHVDLQNPNSVVLKAPTLQTQKTGFLLVAVNNPNQRYKSVLASSRTPPDWRWYEPDKTPLYLSTQRLRI